MIMLPLETSASRCSVQAMNELAVRVQVRIGALPVLAGCLLVVFSGCHNFVDGLVADESGFEGGVTVLEARREGAFGVVTVAVPFLDIYGNPQTGRARLVIHKDQIGQPVPAPAFCHVHYEMGVDGAKKWAGRGWAVFSPVYTEDAPIAVSMGDGNNQARAIIQWARRCPFVDPVRLHLDGGSQGGYMALAMSADLFPVTSATADAPVANWAYNFNYFETNRPLNEGAPTPFEAPLPVMAAVTALADMSYEHFPRDLADETWFHLSPISQVARIANPVMLTIATGDMLVPMEQITRNHLHPHLTERFPEGYVRDFDTLAPSEQTRLTLEEVLPENTVHVETLPLQENSYIITLDMRLNKEPHPDKKPAAADRPWSQDHQWNLVYLDEGPPEPFADHFTWAWSVVPDSFVAYYRDAPPAPDILNAAKLERLLQRYTGAMGNLPSLADGTPANRRNFDAIEKRDVLQGLIHYAALSPDHEERLFSLYETSPLKPFGAHLDADVLRRAVAEIGP